MATKKRKRKSSKRRTRRAPASNPAPKKRRTRRRRKATVSATVSNPRRRRRSKARRSHVSSRRRRNAGPSIGGMSGKKLAMLTGLAVAGGLIGLFASGQVDAHVAQSPRILGAGKLALAGAGILAGIKLGQPAIGLGAAAALGASGGMNLLASFTAPPAATGAPPPAMPPPGGDPYAMPPPQMAAVVDDYDMAGHEGMAAIQDSIGEDEAGNPIFSDEWEGLNADPYTGSGAAW